MVNTSLLGIWQQFLWLFSDTAEMRDCCWDRSVHVRVADLNLSAHLGELAQGLGQSWAEIQSLDLATVPDLDQQLVWVNFLSFVSLSDNLSLHLHGL